MKNSTFHIQDKPQDCKTILVKSIVPKLHRSSNFKYRHNLRMYLNYIAQTNVIMWLWHRLYCQQVTIKVLFLLKEKKNNISQLLGITIKRLVCTNLNCISFTIENISSFRVLIFKLFFSLTNNVRPKVRKSQGAQNNTYFKCF